VKHVAFVTGSALHSLSIPSRRERQKREGKGGERKRERRGKE